MMMRLTVSRSLIVLEFDIHPSQSFVPVEFSFAVTLCAVEGRYTNFIELS